VDAPAAGVVVEAWSRLFAYLVVAIVATVTVILPFFGLVLALAAASYLRAGDIHARRNGGGLLRSLAGPLTAPLDLLRGFAGTLVSLPYAAVPAVLVPLAAMATAAVNIEVHPLVGAAWGAGAAAYVMLAAPGLRAPRRHLVRVFTLAARGPHSIAAIGLLLCALTLASTAGAIVLRPGFTPLYELKNSITQDLFRFQHSVRHSVS
jgi:hypothetical protein